MLSLSGLQNCAQVALIYDATLPYDVKVIEGVAAYVHEAGNFDPREAFHGELGAERTRRDPPGAGSTSPAVRRHPSFLIPNP